ncbi:MAG: S1/P1 nuclease [Planctomycetota bacterium]
MVRSTLDVGRQVPGLTILSVLLLFGGTTGGAVKDPVSFAPFGRDGHRIVAALAERLLSPVAAQEADRLLDGFPLDEIASWADFVKQERNQGPDHYINTPRTARSIDLDRDANGGRNVVDAIRRYSAILEDRSRTDLQRKEALQYLVHYVGDIHQPLHVSFSDDRGGNDVEVESFGDVDNLHAVWDSGLLAHRSSDWKVIEEGLAARLTPEVIAWWRAETDPLQWANESLDITRDVYVELPEFEGRLLEAYYERNIARLELRMLAAGIRLAALLNRVLVAAGTEVSAETASFVAPSIYFGNLHSHTSFSDGSGTPEQAYLHARDVAGLDFLAVTEHNHDRAEWGARERRDGILIATNPLLYEGPLPDAVIPVANRLTEVGRFVALYGQEFSTIGSGNHVNVFDIPEVIDVESGDFQALLQWLDTRPDSHGMAALMQFNHPWSSSSPASAEYGFDDFGSQDQWVRALDDRVQLIELINGPAMATTGGHRPADVRERDYLDYLDRGFHLAPTANQDNHYFTWGSTTDARTGVIASELSKAALLAALRQRHVFASEDRNLEVAAWIEGALQGTVITDLPEIGTELEARIWIHDPDEEERTYRIDVLSDLQVGGGRAEVVETFTHDGNTPAPILLDGLLFEGAGQYFVFRVTQISEHGDPDRAWTAPIWLEGPTAVEPELDVRIIALLPDPEGDEKLHEAITLRNFGEITVDLTDWQVRDLAGKTWVLSGLLDPGEERVVSREGQTMAMNNGGDTIELISRDGLVLQSVTYGRAEEGVTIVVTQALGG